MRWQQLWAWLSHGAGSMRRAFICHGLFDIEISHQLRWCRNSPRLLQIVASQPCRNFTPSKLCIIESYLGYVSIRQAAHIEHFKSIRKLHAPSVRIMFHSKHTYNFSDGQMVEYFHHVRKVLSLNPSAAGNPPVFLRRHGARLLVRVRISEVFLGVVVGRPVCCRVSTAAVGGRFSRGILCWKIYLQVRSLLGIFIILFPSFLLLRYSFAHLLFFFLFCIHCVILSDWFSSPRSFNVPVSMQNILQVWARPQVLFIKLRILLSGASIFAFQCTITPTYHWGLWKLALPREKKLAISSIKGTESLFCVLYCDATQCLHKLHV